MVNSGEQKIGVEERLLLASEPHDPFVQKAPKKPTDA
jgi:hypothetical protein